MSRTESHTVDIRPPRTVGLQPLERVKRPRMPDRSLGQGPECWTWPYFFKLPGGEWHIKLIDALDLIDWLIGLLNFSIHFTLFVYSQTKIGKEK